MIGVGLCRWDMGRKLGVETPEGKRGNGYRYFWTYRLDTWHRTTASPRLPWTRCLSQFVPWGVGEAVPSGLRKSEDGEVCKVLLLGDPVLLLTKLNVFMRWSKSRVYVDCASHPGTSPALMSCSSASCSKNSPRVRNIGRVDTAAGVENGQRRNVCAVVKGRQGAQIKGSGGGSANRTTALIIGATWFLKDLGCERFRGRHAAWVGWVAVADGIFVHVCACNLSAVWFKVWDSV